MLIPETIFHVGEDNNPFWICYSLISVLLNGSLDTSQVLCLSQPEKYTAFLQAIRLVVLFLTHRIRSLGFPRERKCLEVLYQHEHSYSCAAELFPCAGRIALVYLL
jgi:hypothetical protein